MRRELIITEIIDNENYVLESMVLNPHDCVESRIQSLFPHAHRLESHGRGRGALTIPTGAPYPRQIIWSTESII